MVTLGVLAAGILAAAAEPYSETAKPLNVVLIVADDLGWAELGCYGQQKIRTPNIDRIAAEGVKFTQFYSAFPVCAPSRCALMTGRHAGRCAIRNNADAGPEGQYPLPAEEVTLAEVLRERGYKTAAVGKWGLGAIDGAGAPHEQGFDLFFGYNNQRHAHNHYPSWLYRNTQKEAQPGNSDAAVGETYSHDQFEREALVFLEKAKDDPFFLYLPFASPHLALQVPEDSLAEYLGAWDDPPYKGGHGYQPHRAPRAAYAAMVTRLDRTVGRLMESLTALGVADRTLVLFTSDNGPSFRAGGGDSEFFQSTGGLRGLKGSVYEGGVRAPLIARLPGRLPAGRTIEFPAAMYDLLPTVCEAVGGETPEGIDGVSLWPALTGASTDPVHDELYWEFAGYGAQQALRWGDWKGVRQNLNKGKLHIELYNLRDDPSEKTDVSARHPTVVAE
ncbi:MAG: arylsulfatase, partial [Planctomycetia bacterium]